MPDGDDDEVTVEREIQQAHQALADAEKARDADLFGSEIIAAGDASRANGRFLSQLSELRRQADYGYGELDENVDALLSRTQQLVSEMEDRWSTRN